MSCGHVVEQPRQVRLDIAGTADGGCVAMIDGLSFDPRDEGAIEAALAPYAAEKADIRVIGGTNIPYRCIGGLIYTMQKQGHRKIGFIAASPESGNAAIP